MRGYRKFIFAIITLLVIYVVAEMNRPKKLDWSVTLAKDDKNPYGAFVLFNQLKEILPQSTIISTREPILNTLEEMPTKNSAYLLIEHNFEITRTEREALLRYLRAGNYVFLSAVNAGKLLTDTLKLEISRRFVTLKDSVTINFTAPALKTPKDYGFLPFTLDGYFKKVDTSRSVVLGENQQGDVNFISMKIGKGTLFIHALPLCFSNAFMLSGSNAGYTSRALSYLPRNVVHVYWDEYYKLGREGSDNPLRVVLNNTWLRWAFWVAMIAVFSLLLFESKRRQRIIPIVSPLQNSTLDFVRTVGNAYFNRHDNKNLALKKISHFTEYVRSRFYLSANPMDEVFISAFSAKTGRYSSEVSKLAGLVQYVQEAAQVDDATLLELNREIDSYYQQFGTDILN